MEAADTTEAPPAAPAGLSPRTLLSSRSALVPGLVAVALFVLWAADNGGYDATTWYWGALVLLATLAVSVIVLGARRRRLSRAATVALCAFGGYVIWSYLSMAWAGTPGWALEGSNRTLLYFLIFTLFLILPWSEAGGLVALVVFALGVGVIAVVLLLRLASSAHIGQLAIDGRLAAPTGYFNASVALFMTCAVLSTVLATRRELPGPLRGLLLAIACACLQLCLMGQSRGWLFTLPIVLVLCILVVPDRLRVVAAAVLPIAGTLVIVHRLIHAFPGQATTASLDQAAARAGHASILITAGVFVFGTLIAWADTLVRVPSVSGTARLRLGAAVTVLVLLIAGAGAVAATHGDPFGFIKRQWHGFSHQATGGSGGSHFTVVGSGRYDFWRVSLTALAAHPVGGLGQDNFSDYYVRRRRTGEEPRWTHSLEMRLLAHTGLVGFGLFVAFIAGAVAAALPALRRASGLTRAVAGAALLPLIVWLVHGSVDWFWEIPALSGPALGFLGMACAFGMAQARDAPAERSAASVEPAPPKARRRRIPAFVTYAAGALAFVAALVVLTFPYLSARELAAATTLRQTNPNAALSKLNTAANLNPWTPDPTRLAGTIALNTDQFTIAQQRFRQTIDREPGGWFGWLGAGLAASALNETSRAAHDFTLAASINSMQPAIQRALDAVYTQHPLTAAQVFAILAATG